MFESLYFHCHTSISVGEDDSSIAAVSLSAFSQPLSMPCVAFLEYRTACRHWSTSTSTHILENAGLSRPSGATVQCPPTYLSARGTLDSTLQTNHKISVCHYEIDLFALLQLDLIWQKDVTRSSLERFAPLGENVCCIALFSGLISELWLIQCRSRHEIMQLPVEKPRCLDKFL
jgi:hypothetical protein